MVAMDRLNRIWQSNTTSFTSKFKLYKFLVTSVPLHGFETWACRLEKGSRLSKSFSTWSTRPVTGCRARSTWVHKNLFVQLSGDGNLHGLGMSRAMTASLKPSSRAPWRVRDAVVDSRNAGWTTSKSGRTCLLQNCWQWPAENTGRESLQNHLSCPPKDLICQRTELNWTDARVSP